MLTAVWTATLRPGAASQMRDAKRTPGGSLRECRRRCEYVRPSNPPPPSTRQSSGPRSGQETIGAPTHSMRPSPTSANTSNQVTVRAGSRITTRLSTDPARQRTDRRLGALVGTLGQPRLIQGVRLAGSPPMPPGEARADFLRSVHAIVADGSTVVSELALRRDSRPKPECHRRRVLRHEAGGVGYWF